LNKQGLHQKYFINRVYPVKFTNFTGPLAWARGPSAFGGQLKNVLCLYFKKHKKWKKLCRQDKKERMVKVKGT